MGPRIGTYHEEREGGRSEPRMLIDVRRFHVWIALIATLLGMFISAATGLWAAAHKVVPPIAREAVAPEIAAIRSEHAELRKELQEADRTNLKDVRDEMAALSRRLDTANTNMTNLLLQLAAQSAEKPRR